MVASRPKSRDVLRQAFGFGLGFGLLTGAALVADSRLLHAPLGDRRAIALALFTLAAVLAGFIARLLDHLLRLRRNSARLALMLILLMIGTGGLSAFFTFVNLYMNEVHWHAPFPSILWFIQAGYTAISAGYIFAVIGTRLFLPFGLLVLFCAAIVATRDRQRL